MIQSVFTSYLPIDELFTIRKNVLSGGSSPRRLCVVTGTHGDELEGQLVCFLLASILRKYPGCLDGTVEIWPALNPLGIDTLQRGIPNFDLDMNRIFPGDPEGTMAEQTARAIVDDLSGADMVIDIHSSNLFLRETPQVRINEASADTLVEPARQLGVDFIWIHDAATVLEATLAHSLNSTGTPCLVAEMGVGQRINRRLCQSFTAGVLRLMREMGMWSGPLEYDVSCAAPKVCRGDSVEFLNAGTAGVFLTDLHCGIDVTRGQEIGCIVEPLTGDVLSRVTAPCDGYLFTIRAYPIVYEGALMARIYREWS